MPCAMNPAFSATRCEAMLSVYIASIFLALGAVCVAYSMLDRFGGYAFTTGVGGIS